MIPTIPQEESANIDVNEGYLDKNEIEKIITNISFQAADEPAIEVIKKVVSDANLATSPGNSQRWLWRYKNGILLLFLDKKREIGFADNFSFGSLVGLGCALENLKLSSEHSGYNVSFEIIDDDKLSSLAAKILFHKINQPTTKEKSLYEQIPHRCSNRQDSEYQILSDFEVGGLMNQILPENTIFRLITEKTKVDELGKLICRGDRIRLTNEYGHQDFFKNEIRWSREESEAKKDGLDITLFNLTELDKIGLTLSKELETIKVINKINGGLGFERISEKAFIGASAVGVIAIPTYSRKNLINAGIATEKIWLKATELKLGFQPYTVLQMLFSRLYQDSNGYINSKEHSEIHEIKEKFDSILPEFKAMETVFLFRLNYAKPPTDWSFRKRLEDKLIIG